MGIHHVFHHRKFVFPAYGFIHISPDFGSRIPLFGRTPADAFKVMESFDMFLNGNFVALTAFQRKYGVPIGDGKYAIPTRWQSALFQAGQCGAFVGVFLAGPITNRLGYRWTTILSLILMNATIFISFFVSSLIQVLSLVPNFIYLGRFTRSPHCRTGIGRCTMGPLHRELASLCQ